MSTRIVTPKRWQTLVAVGTAASIAQAMPLIAQTTHQHAQVWLAQASGEAGESGEGGESGGIEQHSDTVALLTGLSLIEGHLRAGIALYRAGAADMAKTHMKHPKAEIYTDLEPLLGDDGFAPELATLAEAVEGGSDVATADAAFDAVLEKIVYARSENHASPRALFDAMMATMRVAADEYAIGVTDGAISNMHEYQDAWGFAHATRELAQSLTTSDDATVAAAAQKTLVALAETEAVFDGIAPEGTLNGDASALYGAAARIELAALSVK